MARGERVRFAVGILLVIVVLVASALDRGGGKPTLFGVRCEFLLFGLTLAGVALLHRYTFEVAVGGLTAVLILKVGIVGFDIGRHLVHEALILFNLFGLLLGFALLARHFEDSRLPALLPNYLPDNWLGGFVLLVGVAVLSSFLDNIAAAMIGGTAAGVVFRRRVHVGYLAAIVAASNAGGSGSVVGDTTTTMIWLDGIGPLDVVKASVGAAAALVVSGLIAARQQQAYAPITKDAPAGLTLDWARLGIVAGILAGAIAGNIAFGLPAVGVWAALLLGAFVRKTAWYEARGALKGSIFLLSLVLAASLMPVEELPRASWPTALGLGFLSAVFDNIPLTKLALAQGEYDWGFIAFAVGYGGSMVWFGSSAGVALSNRFPEAKTVSTYVRRGWHVIVAYLVGFFVMLAVVGWHPHPPHRTGTPASPTATTPAAGH